MVLQVSRTLHYVTSFYQHVAARLSSVSCQVPKRRQHNRLTRISFESTTSSSHQTFITKTCIMLRLCLMTGYMFRLVSIPCKSIPDTFYLISKYTKQNTFVYWFLNYNFCFTTLTSISQNSHYFAEAQLVEALCYKLEGSWFDSRWCDWKFSLT